MQFISSYINSVKTSIQNTFQNTWNWAESNPDKVRRVVNGVMAGLDVVGEVAVLTYLEQGKYELTRNGKVAFVCLSKLCRPKYLLNFFTHGTTFFVKDSSNTLIKTCVLGINMLSASHIIICQVNGTSAVGFVENILDLFVLSLNIGSIAKSIPIKLVEKEY